MKYLGIDYGEAKVGLAIGDDESRLALPYKILKNSGWTKLFSDLNDIFKAEAVQVAVVGLPVRTSGGVSEQTEKVRKFARELSQNSAIEITTHDERLSSREAQKLGAGKRDDDVAAMIILQNYLDGKI